jgi:hypothetical protein
MGLCSKAQRNHTKKLHDIKNIMSISHSKLQLKGGNYESECLIIFQLTMEVKILIQLKLISSFSSRVMKKKNKYKQMIDVGTYITQDMFRDHRN